MGSEIGDPRVDVRLQPLQLDEPESGADFRRLEIVADALEHELGVIFDALKSHPEAFLRVLGIDEQRGASSPAAQQPRLVRPVVAIDADVRARPGAAAAERRAERVGRILDHQQVVRGSDLSQPVPVGQVTDQRRHHHRPRVGSDHRLDLLGIDVEGIRLNIDERGHEAVLDQGRHCRGEG